MAPDSAARWPTPSAGTDKAKPTYDPPTVTAIEPNTVALGAPSFTVHVRGTGFHKGSVILWNGLPEPTALVSPEEVTTGVNMAVWAAPATVPVTVHNGGAPAPALDFTFTEAPPPLEGRR